MIGRHAPRSARFFWPEQRAQLDKLFEAILPGSDDSPGASDVAAAELIDRELAIEPVSYHEVAAWRALYVAGLAALDAACRAQAKVALVAATPEQVHDLLAGLAAGTLTAFPAGPGAIDQKKLFATLRAHCIEGCFADPSHGGNRGGAMWRWYGYLETSKPFHRGGAR
ncbi:MAG TPA: gluconate 2-dehydrogenase subunit 3 family protein [Kofleriaceae bacterium]